MKLRNKKTGEIVEPFGITCVNGRTFVQFDDGKGTFKLEVHSLAELEREWGDVPEEPKDNNYWYIDDFGRIQFSSEILDEVGEHPNNWMARKLFGNYFGTREEAEKAVEKLKAVKRLKDKGFEITEWKFTPDMKHIKGNFITIKAEIPYIVENQADLDLLFGGEE